MLAHLFAIDRQRALPIDPIGTVKETVLLPTYWSRVSWLPVQRARSYEV